MSNIHFEDEMCFVGCTYAVLTKPHARNRTLKRVSIPIVDSGRFYRKPLAGHCCNLLRTCGVTVQNTSAIRTPVKSLAKKKAVQPLPPIEATACEETPLPPADETTQHKANASPPIGTGSNFLYGGQGITHLQSHHSTLRRENLVSITLTHDLYMVSDLSIKNPQTQGICKQSTVNRKGSEEISNFITNVNSNGHVDREQIPESPALSTACRAELSSGYGPHTLNFALEHCPALQSGWSQFPIVFEELYNEFVLENFQLYFEQESIFSCLKEQNGSQNDISEGQESNSTNIIEERHERPYEELLVVAETGFGDGRYGTCHECGCPIVIPGLAQFYCANCGWICRPVDVKSVVPGHHD